MWQQAMEEWRAREAERDAALASVAGGTDAVPAADAPQYVAYVPLPDQKEIEARVLEVKKANLITKYASEGLLKTQQQARSLLNKQ